MIMFAIILTRLTINIINKIEVFIDFFKIIINKNFFVWSINLKLYYKVSHMLLLEKIKNKLSVNTQ